MEYTYYYKGIESVANLLPPAPSTKKRYAWNSLQKTFPLPKNNLPVKMPPPEKHPTVENKAFEIRKFLLSFVFCLFFFS